MKSEIEWQPAIITWGEGEPSRPECLAMKGMRVHVTEIDASEYEREASCDSMSGRIFQIRPKDIPSGISRTPRFLICEHDIISD